ncbi:MAG: hypothetical protein PUP93_24840 [Rhizonema sp. NSF051]|nr:hypothetical protein [Rhizonema sp. NSF051]
MNNRTNSVDKIQQLELTPVSEPKLPRFQWAGWWQECPECDRYGTHAKGNEIYCQYCNLFRGFLDLRAEK